MCRAPNVGHYQSLRRRVSQAMKGCCTLYESIYAVACILIHLRMDIFLPSRILADAQVRFDARLQLLRPLLGSSLIGIFCLATIWRSAFPVMRMIKYLHQGVPIRDDQCAIILSPEACPQDIGLRGVVLVPFHEWSKFIERVI